MYSTLNDIKSQLPEEVLIQLTDDNALGTVDEEKVNQAIANADAEIDGYCSVKYRVPLDPVPAIIKRISAHLTIYDLYSRRVEVMPEVRAENRKSSIKHLENISRGIVKLGELAEVVQPQPAQSPEITSSPRLWGRDRTRGL